MFPISLALHRINRYRRFRGYSPVVVLLAFCYALPCGSPVKAAEVSRGAELYARLCAECHGGNGQGVADKYDEVLYGDRSLIELTSIIEKTMPEADPEACVGDDARLVAEYMYDNFYTAEARARHKPPREDLLRLTKRQYAEVIADLVGSFRGPVSFGDQRGLTGRYFKSRGFGLDKKAFERIDSRVDFQYAEGSPDEQIPAEEFSMRWSGSLLAEETGDYEFNVKSENGIRLWVNETEAPLIDAWVSSGGDVREHRAVVRLLGGRAYPLRLEYFKYKEKSASVSLQWRPPGGAPEVIPARHLATSDTPATCVITTDFPADDRSLGYARGSAVSEAWDTATTRAAIEVANYVVDHQAELSGVATDAADRRERLEAFCEAFAERAFRRPLNETLKAACAAGPFASTRDLDEALKRSVLITLKSPWFLYVGLDAGRTVDESAAERLALALWDSIPDEELRRAAGRGELHTEEALRANAQRMLADARTKAKIRGFFHEWLAMEEGRDVSKDSSTFPNFDATLIGDLRTSLEMFIDEVIWKQSGDYRQLLLADFMFMNDRLAAFYGAPPVGSPDDFIKIVYEPGRRAGVITHPYLLSALAYHRSSSPIHRGVFLTRRVLGRALKPPPMAIVFMDAKFDPTLTMREKVTELTKSDTCQTCHSIINPLGFCLENFDAVGRFRWQDKDQPVDARADYTTPTGGKVELAGARDLAEYAVHDSEAQRGFVQQLFQYLVKQPAPAFGPTILDQLREQFAERDCSVPNLTAEIAVVYAQAGAAGRDLAQAPPAAPALESEATASDSDPQASTIQE